MLLSSIKEKRHSGKALFAEHPPEGREEEGGFKVIRPGEGGCISTLLVSQEGVDICVSSHPETGGDVHLEAWGPCSGSPTFFTRPLKLCYFYNS